MRLSEDSRFPDLLRVATDSIELCRVRAEEKVVVYTDADAEAVVADAWFAACHAKGCEPTIVVAPSHPNETDPTDVAVAAMLEADVVFDVGATDQTYAPFMRRVTGQGARVLQVLMPADVIPRRAPDPAAGWRADVSATLLREATTIRVSTPAGTELRAQLSRERPLDVARGYVREPGQWDSFGTSLIAVAPIEASVQGHIAFDGPLILLPDDSFVPGAPIHADVVDGRLSALDASHPSARTLDDWFSAFDDPEAYVFSHIGWGLDPKASVADDELTAWESLFGGVMLAFGSNSGSGLGGAVESLAHMDGILLGASLWLDDRPILLDGMFTEASGLGKEDGR